MENIIELTLDLVNEVLEHSDDSWLLEKARQLKTNILIYENELSQGSD